MVSKQTIEAMMKAGLNKDEAEKLAERFTLAEARRATVKRLMGAGFTGNEAEAIYAKLRRRPKKGKLSILKPKKEVKAIKYETVTKVERKESEEEKKYRTMVNELLQEFKRTLPKSVIDEVIKGSIARKLNRPKVEKVVAFASEAYERNKVDPTEACGIVGAQSIGEPGTQMSLAHDERVLVAEGGAVKSVPIGEFVDALMSRFVTSTEDATEWCDLPASLNVKVPSLSAYGKIEWKALQSVSRHRYERPLLRLVTRSGRSILATDNHSFVTRRDGKIVPIVGRELQAGDHVPVVRSLPVPEANGSLHLRDVLPPEEYWFGSELAKAKAFGPDWRDAVGHEILVPVGNEQLANQIAGHSSFPIEAGFVYPYQTHTRSRIPEVLPLDDTFGWLVGAYLAEGSAFRYHVNISNTDHDFLARTRASVGRLGIHMSEHDNTRGFSTGHDLHAQSTVLSELLRRTSGHGSASKRVPDFAFGASDALVAALLRAYFDGDGNVTVQRKAVRASSRSRELLDGIALLLSRFGIFASKGASNGLHTLWIPARFAPTFREKIGFESSSNREALDALCAVPKGRYSYDALDVVAGFGTLLLDTARMLGLPTRTVRSATNRQRIGRATLRRQVEAFERAAVSKKVDVSTEVRTLRGYLEEDVVWDELVQIERVSSSVPTVYDFSVPGLETFTTSDGLITHNTMRTFHYAGVAEINVTLGLPRLIEIVDARRVPSTPLMNIFLEHDYARNPELVQRVANKIETTYLKDIADLETDLGNMTITVKPIKKALERKDIEVEDIAKAMQKIRRVQVQVKGGNITITLDEPSYKRLDQLTNTIRDLKVKGIDGIKRVVIRKEGEEFVIYSEGSNLAEVLQLDGVEKKRVMTNDVQGIYEVLGIEAARNAIISEAHNTLSEQGLTVDLRHLMLVSDVMTVDGTVRAIGRQGVSGEKSSILARAAFEITVDHLLRAGMRGEVDSLHGVAENIIVGQPVNLGTGAVKLTVDPEKMAQAMKITAARPPPPPPKPKEEPAAAAAATPTEAAA